MKHRTAAVSVVLLASALGSLGSARGCARLHAEQGQAAFEAERFDEAIEHYQRALRFAPDVAEVHFHLAACHQALYQPGTDATKRWRLGLAILEYRRTLDTATPEGPDRILVNKALWALARIYADSPFRNLGRALSYSGEVLSRNPNDIGNLLATANLRLRFDQGDFAEQTYRKALELSPNQRTCGALATFYRRPLRDGRNRIDDAILVLEHCASLAPEDPTRLYKLATFCWEKAFRDRTLSEEQKRRHARKGLDAVNRALMLKPDYLDAMAYRGLLCRLIYVYRDGVPVAGDPSCEGIFPEPRHLLVPDDTKPRTTGSSAHGRSRRPR